MSIKNFADMKISVITVVLNDLEGLRKTTQSVLAQKGDCYEYVVLDGGSSDGCWEYIESLNFSGVKKSEPDAGIYNAMNHAVQLASGDYCLFMNAGDTFYDENVLQKAAGIIGQADFYVGHTMEFGKNILNGDIKVNPYEMDSRGACKYCEYKGICGFDEKIPGYSKRKFDLDDKEAMELIRNES